MHQSSYIKMEKFVDKYLDKDRELTILDIGSQDVNGTYKPLFNNPNWNYFGVDMLEAENVDIVLKNIYNWREIKSNSIDVVVSGQAFEHIEFFWVSMFEVSRVLKKDGFCCIIAPSSGFEHRYPVDCWRFYPDGFKALAKYSYLSAIDIYTEWEKLEYSDGENIWHDSVLIAQKPKLSLRQKIMFKLKNLFLKITVGAYK